MSIASLGAAYSESAAAWRAGPDRVYGRLAEAVLDAAPVPVTGRTVLDVGAGTGALTRAAMRRGASVVAVDVALGMLQIDRRLRPAAAVADVRCLPVRARSIDCAFAAFSLNHLDDPVAGLREMARVVVPAGEVVASVYATDDDHPAKSATERAMRAWGWRPPEWHGWFRERAVPMLASADAAACAAAHAGLADVHARRLAVRVPDLDALDLVRWRLGMAHAAPFVAALEPDDRRRLEHDAVVELGDEWPCLVRSIVVVSGRAAFTTR